jgi:hypothetical protein
MRFTDRERSASHYIGYVSTPISRAEIEAVRGLRGLRPGERWVVCSAGSGFYNRQVIDDCLGLSREFSTARFDLVAGPSGSPPERPDEALFGDERMQMAADRPDLRMVLAAADIVICRSRLTGAAPSEPQFDAPRFVQLRAMLPGVDLSAARYLADGRQATVYRAGHWVIRSVVDHRYDDFRAERLTSGSTRVSLTARAGMCAWHSPTTSLEVSLGTV